MKLPPIPNFAALMGLPDAAGNELLKALRAAPAMDPAALTRTIERALASAGLDLQSEAIQAVQQQIQRSLGGSQAAAWPTARSTASVAPDASGDVIDVEAREVAPAEPVPSAPPASAEPPSPARTDAADDAPPPGRFVSRSFRNAAGSRNYKLFVPGRGDAGRSARPLLLMLHGCTQSPDDFAAGTRMNELAEQQGFLVCYPEQAARANGSRCWNWFRPQDQLREQGEPSLIAGIAREVMNEQDVDPRQVFVAGLSAGAAMAVILGETYPELFAAIGVHSGLSYAAAHDVPSALSAMNGSAGLGGVTLTGAVARPPARLKHAVRTIVFHGDHDGTVAPDNGDEVAAQALQAWSRQAALQRSESAGTAAGGRAYRRSVHSDAHGRPVVESWLLSGAGHAWSGGSRAGTYTDERGPDASAEMLRFFFAQQVG